MTQWYCDTVHQTDDLLTSTQVGRLLNKSSRTVIRMAEAGTIPIALKLPGPNGHFLFRRSDIEAHIDELSA